MTKMKPDCSERMMLGLMEPILEFQQVPLCRQRQLLAYSLSLISYTIEVYCWTDIKATSNAFIYVEIFLKKCKHFITIFHVLVSHSKLMSQLKFIALFYV